MKIIRTVGQFKVFGIPLILCHMPCDFRFNSTPEYKFKVWASLPNFPLDFGILTL